MAKKVTIESRAQKAVKSLQKYLKESNESDKSQLFDDEPQQITMSITAKKFFSNKRNLKPQLVQLKHSIYGKEKPSVCIFVKDPQRSYKDVLQTDDEKIVDRVVGVTKLKGKFKPYEARRALKSQYDLFLAEDDVVTLLPKLLGKSFYGSQSSVPIPVRIRKGDEISAKLATKQVQKVIGATTFIVPGSTRLSVRVGTSDQTPKQIAENVAAVLEYLKTNTLKELGGEDFLRTIALKTRDSPALPIFQTEELFTEADIGEGEEEKPETEKAKRKRENAHLDSLLAEIVDEDEIKEYNREQKKLRSKKANKGAAKATEGAEVTEPSEPAKGEKNTEAQDQSVDEEDSSEESLDESD